MYQWDFTFLTRYSDLFIKGLLVSLAFTAFIVVAGLLIGLLVGLGRVSRFVIIRGVSRLFVETFRCTPLLVQLVWFFYALPILTGIQMSAISAGAISLSLYGAAFYAEIFRAGINSIDVGQAEAGRALGMTNFQNMRRIILPQAFKRMVPPILSQGILQFKNTSLLSTLAIPDFLYQGQVVAHDTYRPLEVYTFVAVAYLAVLFPLTVAVQHLEQRFGEGSKQ
jgi:polar amino acid transport system permease protein